LSIWMSLGWSCSKQRQIVSMDVPGLILFYAETDCQYGCPWVDLVLSRDRLSIWMPLG
jgi:hypothetical protein